MSPDMSNLREVLSIMGIQVEPKGGVGILQPNGSLKIAVPLSFRKWSRFYRPDMAKPRAAGRKWGTRATSERAWHARPEPVSGELVTWWFRPEGNLQAEEDLSKLPPGTRTIALSNGDGTFKLVPDTAVVSSWVRRVGSTEHGWHWLTGPLGVLAFHGPSVGAALHSARDA